MLETMLKHGWPYNRETYLSFIYGPDDVPDPLPPEEEASLPPEFRLENQEQPQPSRPSPIPAPLKRVSRK